MTFDNKSKAELISAVGIHRIEVENYVSLHSTEFPGLAEFITSGVSDSRFIKEARVVLNYLVKDIAIPVDWNKPEEVPQQLEVVTQLSMTRYCEGGDDASRGSSVLEDGQCSYKNSPLPSPRDLESGLPITDTNVLASGETVAAESVFATVVPLTGATGGMSVAVNTSLAAGDTLAGNTVSLTGAAGGSELNVFQQFAVTTRTEMSMQCLSVTESVVFERRNLGSTHSRLQRLNNVLMATNASFKGLCSEVAILAQSNQENAAIADAAIENVEILQAKLDELKGAAKNATSQ